MKKLTLLILFASVSLAIKSQDLNLPLYKRDPNVPPLRLLLADSSTVFTGKNLKKNVPVFIILFSPDCDHCQKETEELIDSIDRFKNIQIVMATTLPFDKMKAFIKTNQLTRFKNITVGWDKSLILPTFFMMRNFPFLGLYDKNWKLIEGIEGALPVHKVLEKFQQ